MYTKFIAGIATAVVLSAGAASAATTFTIDVGEDSLFSTNSPATGSSASLTFAFEQVTAPGITSDVKLTVTVDNTTGDGDAFGSGATASKLVGFAFTTPDAVSLGDTASNYVGSSYFPYLLLNDDSVNGNQFNSITFDLGGGLKSTLEGSGSPSAGLDPEDGTTSVSFYLKGLDEVTMASYFEDGFEDGTLKLGLRFKAVNGTGADSDKLLYVAPTTPVPLPAGGLLLLTGLGGIALMRRRAKA